MVEKSHVSGFWPSMYEPFRLARQQIADWIAPASEASAKPDVYSIAIELPGVQEDDIEVTLQEGVVSLKGEKRSAREEKGETWFFSERQYGAFSRSFRLPPDADGAALRADLKDGVLTLTIPKLAAKPDGAGARVKINRA